jgi:hypothetical protein
VSKGGINNKKRLNLKKSSRFAVSAPFNPRPALGALSFACVLLCALSFTVTPLFALWIGRVCLLIQAYVCLSAILDRYRF